ncbi:hypothetical protein PLICRDRAFT_536428 [Plicaturopsis crispa FD-325 SS-3]|nr:hypothetical protein PLICRDRAFT_536428 [Plicaturopsis crispa FD-325 SS-3]
MMHRTRDGSRHARGRHTPAQSGGSGILASPVEQRQQPAKKPFLTHFIALPIGHHAPLRERISSFMSALQAADPKIEGLHESIIIAPRRLHFTLGVMSLAASSKSTASSSAESQPASTLDAAISLLQALRPRIIDLLAASPLRVTLDRMSIMPPDRSGAHVLWLAPNEDNEETRRLRAVAELIQREFMRAGLAVDERRPLKLHCTIVNTIYRKPKPKGGRRIPFSYDALLRSAAFRDIGGAMPEEIRSLLGEGSAPPTIAHSQTAAGGVDALVEEVGAMRVTTERDEPRSGKDTGASKLKRLAKVPVSVDFGTWDVGEVQICAMGSYGEEGEYVSCGGIHLGP